MSALAIAGIAYGSGFVAGLFVVGATGARWWDDKADPSWGFLTVVWPLALPWLLGRLVARRRDRLRLAAEERKRWLEAPIGERAP